MNSIELNIRDLYYYCTDSKENRKIFLDNMLFIRDKYNSKIHNYSKVTPYDKLHFMHNLEYSCDMEGNNTVTLNGKDLLSGICNMLSIDKNGLSEEETLQLVNENIEKLKTVEDRTLRDIYPVLYDLFQVGLGMYHRWSPMDMLDPYNPEEQEIYERLNKERKKFFSHGLRPSYKGFTASQADYIEKYCKRFDLKEIYFNGLNNDKLNLYIFGKYLDKVEESNNSKDQIELLNLLKSRIPTIRELNDNIRIKDNVNKTALLARYVLLNRKYNIPKSVKINGAILPSSDDRNKKGNKVIGNYKPLSDEEREELIGINRKKKEFYSNSGYLTVISEKENLTGNQAFVYPNGHILEDYIADEENDASLKKNKKNAIYHVDIYGFEDLVDMGKLEVRQDDRCHGYFMHTGEWVSRLEKVVKIDATPEVFEDTKQFIKRLETKKSSK